MWRKDEAQTECQKEEPVVHLAEEQDPYEEDPSYSSPQQLSGGQHLIVLI